MHYCPATKNTINREYRDGTSLSGMPTSSTYPTKDDQGNLLETEFGLSVYRDVQKLTIQEMPERAPPGQLPCSIDKPIDAHGEARWNLTRFELDVGCPKFDPCLS